MKQRCYYSNHISYPTYGGRGITICDEWKNDFKAFYDWAIANGYQDDLSIDRIDVNGNYDPNNCRWATNREQSRNKSQTRYVTLMGKTKTITDWCKDLNIPYHRVHYRLRKGLSIEEAFKCEVI
jgi:allantoicase